ncbi:DOMON-like domain-containing protein [Phenylobacterium sp.]|uniref:DOMON-like domain-containing protein n=1 Tax=Phenylobacterium sp. TaxID=1871053 RepID=UPI0025D112B0|nr:DOMON-like domain-containing protein [Phenylobacterium sp.]
MAQALTPHPSTPCSAVRALTVEARREGARLVLIYRLTGDLGMLAIPPAAAADRTDSLWEHTCFEAFVGGEGGGYLEFNLSPSGQWAAYRFDGYRAGMAALEMAAPRIETTRTPDVLELRAELELPDAGSIRVGLTAVIEATDGTVSYWSLAHPPGHPDFHQAGGRVLAL